MASPLPYHTSFVLDKAHFSECFDQSVTTNGIRDYTKAAIVAALGSLLVLFIDVDKYVAYFVLALGAVEALSVYYRKTWWLWRQMISKAYDHKVDIEMTDSGVITSSFHVNNTLLWEDVEQIVETESGLLLHHKRGMNYLSKSYLSDEVINYIKQLKR